MANSRPPPGVVGLLRKLKESNPAVLRVGNGHLSQPMYMGEKRRPGKVSLGVMDWADGCQYQGSFQGQHQQGHGLFRFDWDPEDQQNDELCNGCIIEGHFHENHVTGYARFVCSEGFCLVPGEAGQPQCEEGCDKWENCKEYVGEWVNNLREGVGIMTCHDGTTLQGVWVQDRFHPELCTERVETVVAASSPVLEQARAAAASARQLAFSAVKQQMSGPPKPAPPPASSAAAPAKPGKAKPETKNGKLWGAVMQTAGSFLDTATKQAKELMSEKTDSGHAVSPPTAIKSTTTKADLSPKSATAPPPTLGVPATGVPGTDGAEEGGAAQGAPASRDAAPAPAAPPPEPSSSDSQNSVEMNQHLMNLLREQITMARAQLREEWMGSTKQLQKELERAHARCATLEARLQETSEASASAGAASTTQPNEATALVESLLSDRLGPLEERVNQLTHEQCRIGGAIDALRLQLESMERTQTEDQDQEKLMNEAVADTAIDEGATGAGSSTTSFPDSIDCEPESHVCTISKEKRDEEAAPREASPLQKKRTGDIPSKTIRFENRLRSMEESQQILALSLGELDKLKSRADEVEKRTETLATEVTGLKQVAAEYNKIMQSHEDRTVKLEKDAGFTNVALNEHQTKIAKFQKDKEIVRDEVRNTKALLDSRINVIEAQQKGCNKISEETSLSINALTARIAALTEHGGSVDYKLDHAAKQIHVFGKDQETLQTKIGLHERVLSQITKATNSTYFEDLCEGRISQDLNELRRRMKTCTSNIKELQDHCENNAHEIALAKASNHKTHAHLQQVEQTVWQSLSFISEGVQHKDLEQREQVHREPTSLFSDAMSMVSGPLESLVPRASAAADRQDTKTKVDLSKAKGGYYEHLV